MRSITEPGGAVPIDMRRDLAYAPVAVEQAADGNAIRPGELDAQSAVTVVFELR